MDAVLTSLYHHLAEGQRAVLCRVISSDGSAPRGAGAQMAVFADGASCGTVGGGAVELHTVRYAGEVLETGVSRLHAFRLAPNQKQDIGMICGGDVTVYLQLLTPQDAPLIRSALDAMAASAPAWLVTSIRDGGRSWEMSVAFHGDGDLLQAAPVLREGEPLLYAEPLVRPGRVFLFGGGHVGAALVPVLRMAAFRVTVYDDRPETARRESFPDAEEVICAGYGEVSARLAIGPWDYVVVMTHGHQGDYTVLEQALRTGASYIGCIGSRQKVAATRQRLLAAGFSEAEADRIHSPIGLPIGAETPAEIAVSVAAEMIAHRAAREGHRHV